MRGTETVPHIRTIAKMTIGAIPEGTFLAQKMHFFAKFLRISRELYADNACIVRFAPNGSSKGTVFSQIADSNTVVISPLIRPIFVAAMTYYLAIRLRRLIPFTESNFDGVIERI